MSVGSLFLVKFYVFGIFFRTPLHVCAWSVKIVLWELCFFFKHSNNIQVAAWNYNSLIAKTLDGNHKNESINAYLSNKEQRATFPVVFLSDHFFGFACPIFTRPIGCATKIVCPKIEVRWNQVCAGLILIGFYKIYL